MSLPKLLACASLVAVTTASPPARAGEEAPWIGTPEPESTEAIAEYDPVFDDDPTNPPRWDHPYNDGTPQRPIDHQGLVFEAWGGIAGCTGRICRASSGHAAEPGPRVAGLVAFNFDGLVELGLTAGYGTLRAGVERDRQAFDVFGIEVERVPSKYMSELDLGTLAIREAKLDDLRVGTSGRFHFKRRGRLAAYAGSGFGYHRFRAKYATPAGAASLSFHGFDVPFELGARVYLTRRVSLGLRAGYTLSYYLAAEAKHADPSTASAMELFDEALSDPQSPIRDALPDIWSASLSLSLTL